MVMNTIESADENSTTSLKNPISRLAYTMAKITLRFNLFVNEFIELYKFHMVLLAKKQNPTNSIVELSARTGLDRRYITETLKNEELKKTNSKVRLVLQQMRQVCKRKNTNLIAKHGNKDSFTSICKQVSSGSLTNNAIATELLRLGEIVDSDRKFEVVNLKSEPVINNVNKYHISRRILNEINATCLKNKSNIIELSGASDSLEGIYKAQDTSLMSLEDVITELVDSGFIKTNETSCMLLRGMYRSNNDRGFLNLLSTELNRLSSTLIELTINVNPIDRKFQRNVYSSQMNPKVFKKVNRLINDLLFKTFHQAEYLLIEHEENVPRDTYPLFGLSMYTFGPNHNID